jgi:hypothetical protein
MKSSSGSVLLQGIEGACLYQFDVDNDAIIEIYKGDLGALPGGNYEFSVIGNTSVDLMLVWNYQKNSTRKNESKNNSCK